ncbi:MAG: DEAD/DEAH box helicase [Acidiphilium sp.]|nr:DEAD/DEAH box helicase [Acidiphilium sp.]MDD4935416.1 DEAD/DEAH box helicase [Acidiphilium sp.]
MKLNPNSDETLIIPALERLESNKSPQGFSRETMAQGRAYAQRGQVVAVALAKAGTVLTADVIGTAPRPYAVEVSTRHTAWAVQIDGHCTCPVGHNCKHVAAALVHAARPEIRRYLALTYPAAPKIVEELSPALQIWMNDLRLAQAGADEEYPTDVRQRLLYVLKALDCPNPQARDIGVETVSVRLLKDGSLSTSTTAYPPHTLDDRGAGGMKFLRPSDREILPRLARLAQRGGSSRLAVRLAGAEGTALLRAILATGRSHWNEVSGPAMRQDDPITAGITWALNPDGSQSPTLDLPPDCLAIRLTPPWCIAPQSGMAQPVRTGLADRFADTVLSAPPVPPEQAETLRTRLARDVPTVVPHAPPVLAPPERLAVPMVPVLRIEARKQSAPSWTGGYREAYGTTIAVNVARPLFRYGEFEIAARDQRPLPRFTRGDAIVEVVRDPTAEAAAAQTLTVMGFVPVRQASRLAGNAAGDELILASTDIEASLDWLDFFYHDAPRLRDQGWSIICADDVPVRLIKGDEGAFAAALTARDDASNGRIDWFELDLGVIVDGERIDLLPALVDLIGSDGWSPDDLADLDPDDEDEPFYLPLPDGRIFALPRARLMPIVQAIYDLLAAKSHDGDGKLRLSAYDAGLLAALETASGGVGVAWSGGEPLRRLGRMLGETGSIPQATIPDGFAADLRPYQARGVDWLQFLRIGGLAGILADEMGLGKTVQALAHILIEQAEGRLTTPALLIAPTSLVVNWQREAERFAPGLRVLVLHGPDRAERFAHIPNHDLVISTYPLLARDHDVLHEQPWHMVILDEAQIIKNPNALTSRLMRGLKTEHRLCLTGTPLENNLGELWSLFAFLAPELLGDRKQFQKRWRTPIEKQHDTERQALLARYVRPFLLRRTKAAVAAELPPKTEIVESIGMETEQRNLYEGIRLAMHSKVREAIAAKGLARSHIVILEALLRLRQTCCDPRLLKLPAAKTEGVASAKLERLAEMVPELVADGRRILIFSQFTSMLALIETMLADTKLSWVKLTGDTRDRQSPITRFQAGEVPIFLISLKAGGVGLNLTAADTVIHYDPWWNPAVEDQATDRAHRIGQPNPVFVHRLVVANSVEEKMESLKLRKRQLAEGLFDSGAGDTLAFNEADIDDLFS